MVLVDRRFTISEPKDKVNYNFSEGAKFPKGGGAYFLGNMARGVKFSEGGKFPVTPVVIGLFLG